MPGTCRPCCPGNGQGVVKIDTSESVLGTGLSHCGAEGAKDPIHLKPVGMFFQAIEIDPALADAKRLGFRRQRFAHQCADFFHIGIPRQSAQAFPAYESGGTCHQSDALCHQKTLLRVGC